MHVIATNFSPATDAGNSTTAIGATATATKAGRKYPNFTSKLKPRPVIEMHKLQMLICRS